MPLGFCHGVAVEVDGCRASQEGGFSAHFGRGGRLLWRCGDRHMGGQDSASGGPGWALTDAVLHAVFWILLAGAAVFSAGALGFWPGPVARTHRRGLVLGGLLGFLAVIGTAVPDWFVFTTAPTLSQPLQFLSLVWGGTLDFVALVGSFLIAVSVIGLLTRGGSAPRDH